MPTPSDRSFTTAGKRLLVGATLAAVVGVAALQSGGSRAAETAFVVPPPAFDAAVPTDARTETAVFAGGCFWGVQAVFQHTRGVLQAVSGYAGGSQDTATYRRVSSGRTGHAEAVRVTYDPRQVSYGKLLQIHFSVAHDPTQLDRQGPDHGPQYRSAVFPTGAAQREVVEKYIVQLDAAGVYPSRVVTQIAPLAGFYAAEGEHQDYATLHPESGYIATFDRPKLDHLKALFPGQYRAEPALVTQRPTPGSSEGAMNH